MTPTFDSIPLAEQVQSALYCCHLQGKIIENCNIPGAYKDPICHTIARIIHQLAITRFFEMPPITTLLFNPRTPQAYISPWHFGFEILFSNGTTFHWMVYMTSHKTPHNNQITCTIEKWHALTLDPNITLPHDENAQPMGFDSFF